MKVMPFLAVFGFCFVRSSAYGDLNTGLVAYYAFSGNANDLSGNGINGTVNDASLTTDRSGSPNSAYNFAANVNSQITFGDSPLLNFSNAFSVSYWVRFNQPWSYHSESAVWKFDYPNQMGWYFGVNQDDSRYGAGLYAYQFGFATVGSSGSDVAEDIVPFSTI
ncbi:MAG: hypothetical protein C5B50_00310 [Verrucomicrobia bacterium]|nr:MAG: hypothetical protein C5B50_00310 [Verrucomicrobiota bacterium]